MDDRISVEFHRDTEELDEPTVTIKVGVARLVKH